MKSLLNSTLSFIQTTTLFFCISLLFIQTGLAEQNKISPQISTTEIKHHFSKEQIKAFRDQGPKGLEAFLKIAGPSLSEALEQDQASPQVKHYREVLDQICQQKDCDFSRLYWFTDIEKAKAVAQKEQKPILSLRLLGNLDEEYSCANSRFFRTVLYADPSISDYLRDHFILHWQSVRKAPLVTVDFGDGRKLKSTITGNSLHYVLSPQGKVLTVLPGLFSPKIFLAKLESEKKFLNQNMDSELTDAKLRDHYQRQIRDIEKVWAQYADINQVLADHEKFLREFKMPSWRGSPFDRLPPTAQEAMPYAMSKAFVEDPMLRAIQNFEKNRSSLEKRLAIFAKIANRPEFKVSLSEASKQLMKRKEKNEMTSPKKIDDRPYRLIWMFKNFETSIAQDSVQNHFYLQLSILVKLRLLEPNTELVQLDRFIYGQVFRTPHSDPWLGMYSREIYSGLPNGGIQIPSH